jgi:NAD-dependent SIR2 family protein deacetylase
MFILRCQNCEEVFNEAEALIEEWKPVGIQDNTAPPTKIPHCPNCYSILMEKIDWESI